MHQHSSRSCTKLWSQPRFPSLRLLEGWQTAQGLANLPLMLRSSEALRPPSSSLPGPDPSWTLEEWAHLQLLDDGARIFYNDIHEYFLYMLCVPYVPEDVRARGGCLSARPGFLLHVRTSSMRCPRSSTIGNGFSGELPLLIRC